jgi:hypothetical protein
VEILIHHESEDMNCTMSYKESESKIVCTRMISSFSEAESGKYFCSTTIGDEYFSSKVKDIKLDSSASGLGMPVKIAIGGGAFGVVVIVLSISLIVSIAKNVYLKKLNTQLRNAGGQALPIDHDGGPGPPNGGPPRLNLGQRRNSEERPLLPEGEHLSMHDYDRNSCYGPTHTQVAMSITVMKPLQV